jgi:GNAT superfamily N-acetyltransferase
MCSYTEFLVAEVDGQPAAALEGYDPISNGEMTVTAPMAAVVDKMGLTQEDMALPEYRRRGVISKLLEAILDQGCGQGFRLAQVSYYIGNIPGERAYKKAGFQFTDEKRHQDFETLIGCPGMVRMLRDL